MVMTQTFGILNSIMIGRTNYLSKQSNFRQLVEQADFFAVGRQLA